MAPENTVESFSATWDLGAVPEADLRTTSDGVIVAFHDDTLARVLDRSSSDLREKGVQDISFEQLSALDVGSWRSDRFAGQRVCSAAEIFAMMHGRPDRALYMDIKDVYLPQLVGLVREFEVEEQVILAAPDEQLLRAWRNLLTHGQTLLWMGILREGDEDTLSRRLERLRGEDFAGITQLQIHVAATQENGEWQLKPSLEFVRRTARDLKAFGVLFQSLPWECAEPEVYRALLGAGVESFASDYPEVALRVLREWVESHPQRD